MSAQSQSRKERDEVAAASERICAHMNREPAASCLAYAWHLMSRSDAIAAKMTSVSSEGFTLSVTLKDRPSDPVSRTYCFDKPVGNAAEARDKLIALHNQCCKGFVPKEIGVVVTCLAYLLILARCSPLFAGLPLVGDLAGRIFASENAALNTLAVVQFLHVLELLYSIYMCRNLKFSVGIAITWLPLIQVFGMPVTRKLRQLHAMLPSEKEHAKPAAKND